MGNKQGKVEPKFDPSSVGQRESLAAWHRYDVDAYDVYDLIEVLGQGYMGEVTEVRRKEGRNVHNDATRNAKASGDDKSTKASKKKPKSLLRKPKNSEYKAKSSKQASKTVPPPPPTQLSPKGASIDANGTPTPILKKSSYIGVPNLPMTESEDFEDGGDGDNKEKTPAPPPLKKSDEWHERQKKATFGSDNGSDSPPSSSSFDSERPYADTFDSERSIDSSASSSSRGVAKHARNRRVFFQRSYACKTVMTSRVKKGALDELINEIYVMRTLDHPYILPLLEVYQKKRKLWLITELCTGGDLTSRKLDEPQTAIVIEQILRALSYMHKRGVYHRDLKMENVLYENSKHDASIRLIDFGLSQTYDRAQVSRKAIGTAYTLSPEIASSTAAYTDKTDMWAVGVIAWILLAGDYPFVKEADDLEDKFKLNKLINARYDFGITWNGRGISEDARSFCARCLKKNPNDRWSAKEALDFVQKTWLPTMEEHVQTLRKHYGDDEDVKLREKSLENTITAKRRDDTLKQESDEIDFNDISKFCEYGSMKKTILTAMAHTIDRKDVSRLSEIFLEVDTEDVGTLSFKELQKAFKKINPSVSEETMKKMFQGIDQDNSGQIHYAEFIAALAESQGLITKDRLAEAFDRIDKEGKGYISHDDLKMVLGKDYDKQKVDAMIEEADFKKNGQVDYEELLELMFDDLDEGGEALGSFNESLRSLEGFKDISESMRMLKVEKIPEQEE